MQKQFKRIRLILAVAVMAGLTVGGTWTANQFFYKPSLGASGTQEKTTYDTGLDRVDARLGKEIWIGDPAYGSTLASAVTAIGGNQVILRVPAGTATISTDLTVPANITLQLQRGAVLSVADGKTLTINGEIRAGAYQIFAWTGAGAIRLSNALKEVLVDWFIPAGATDHTAYIKKAVDSGNHLVGSGVYARPPVVLTRESYVIANLNFDMGATGLPNYCGLTLSGKPGGGNNGSVKLTVNGANDNGILITGNFTAGGAFANYITLENLQIIKASYPGDARSDYGLKLRRSQWIRLRNVKIKNFGESALFIQDCFFGSFEGFEAETCYRAINLTASTMDPYWACTTMHFVNPSLMGCKILVYNSGGRAHATFSGLTADDFGGFTSTAYVDVSHQTVQLYFDRCWLEGLNAASYGVNFRDGAMYPRYNHITFTDCQLHLKNPSYLVGASGSGTGVISLKMSSISYTDSGDSVLYKDRTVIPNRTDSHACTEVAGLGKADLEGPAIFMSTPTASGTMVTEGPNGVAVGTKGVSSFGGVVNHRYYDDGIVGLSQEYKNDGFISTIGGLITPSLFLRQYYLYGLRLAVASAIPANQTCNTSTATPYKLTNVTNPSTFCRGDTVVITGAGPSGGNLTTQIVQMEWDLSAVYLKDPVQATLSGTGLRISGNKGDVRLNSSPDAGKATHWVCTAAGAPGTWVVGGQTGYRTSSGAPSGVTPYFIGEELLDTTNGKWYKAKGATSSDWVALN